MSDTFVFLQRKYFVTPTGKVVVRITPKAVTRERRKLKAYKRILDEGIIEYPDIEQAARSWMGENVKYMCWCFFFGFDIKKMYFVSFIC